MSTEKKSEAPVQEGGRPEYAENAAEQISDSESLETLVDEELPEISWAVSQPQYALSHARPQFSHACIGGLLGARPNIADIFYGREVVVADLISTFTTVPRWQNQAWVCLLGPSGIGKTSTALTVMAHPDMTKHFPKQNQIWVCCIKATSVSLFLATLSSSLGIRWQMGNVLDNIVSKLRTSTEPLILLLDNFETPWNSDGIKSMTDIEEILITLYKIPQIAVFVMMRDYFPPGKRIRWYSVNLLLYYFNQIGL